MAHRRHSKKARALDSPGPKNGIKKRFTLIHSRTKGKRETLQAYEAWLDSGGINNRLTVARCVALYLEDVESRLGRRDTFRVTDLYTRLYVLPALGRCRMSNLTIRDWQAVINNARPQKDPAKSLSYKTLCHLRGVIVGLHNFAYNNFYCDAWRGSLYIPQGHAARLSAKYSSRLTLPAFRAVRPLVSPRVLCHAALWPASWRMSGAPGVRHRRRRVIHPPRRE